MISDKPWSREAVIRLLLAIVVTSCIGMLLAGEVGSLKLRLSDDQLQALQMLIGTFYIQGMALGWIAVFLRAHATTWRDAFGFLQSSPVKVALYGVMIGLLFLPIAWGLQTLSVSALEHMGVKAEEQPAVQALESPNLSMTTKVVLGALAIVIAPVAEESLFRGIIYPTLKQRGHRALAWWGTSAVFAAMHVNAPSFIPLLAFAMVLTFLYEAYGNLLVPIAAHCVFNAANFLAVMLSAQLDRLFQGK